MLQYNFTKMFRLRGIEEPYYFLRKHGFSHNFTHRIANNKINSFSLEHLEKICTLLGCTPNDLLDWIPKKEDKQADKHPLSALRKEINAVDLPALLREIPLNKMSELQTIMEKMKHP